METPLRRWKCNHCSRANETAIGLDGIGQCAHCVNRTSVQPSRLRNGVVQPAVYPTRMGSNFSVTRVRSLGEV